MALTFDVNELEGMKRAELQKLCKSVGIKANSKTSQLIEGLKIYASRISGTAEDSSVEQGKEPHTADCTEIGKAVKDSETTDFNRRSDTDDDSYKKELMDQLDKKVEEKMPAECKIPRFVQFLGKESSAAETNKTPANKWNKIHKQQFEKMDSIDVYLEKKRKRMEGFNQSVKKARIVVDSCKEEKEIRNSLARKSTGPKRKSRGKPAEVTFKPTVTTITKSSTFVFGSPAPKPFFQPANKTVTKSEKLKLKSPKVFKPIFSGSASNNEKLKTPLARKSLPAAAIKEGKSKTPANPSRKSTAATPFRFLPANAPDVTTPTPRKKFDLQASLAKPLTYKPHTGKLKPISSYKEQCRPTISQTKVKNHKVDVKSVKVTSRDERRKKDNKSRENRRANNLSRRRGLAS